MSATVQELTGRAATPAWVFWSVLAVALASGFAFGFGAGVAIGGLVLVQVLKPFEFLPAYLLVVAGASYVDYSQGNLTRELSILSVGIVFMLFCYMLGTRSKMLAVPDTGFTIPVACYLGLTLLNFLRGMVVGNSLRYGGLELISALAIACAFLVGNHRLTRGAILLSLGALILVSTGNSVLGFLEFAIARQRVGSVFFTAVPGLVALIMLNFALREERLSRALLWILPMVLFLAHQFLSFTRGFWLGLMGAGLYSIIAFGWRSRERWKRAAIVTTLMVGLTSIGIGALATTFGIANLADMALNRLNSSTGTELTYETSSNIVRLVEYARVLQDIQKSPWVGHGLGYYFVMREPLRGELFEQWYCHESYLMVWLKQGVIGLLLFLWMLGSALFTAHKGARAHGGWEGAWCASTAAITVFVLIYSTVYFVLVAEVNTAFLIALMWGGTMAITSKGRWRLGWNRSAAAEGARS